MFAKPLFAKPKPTSDSTARFNPRARVKIAAPDFVRSAAELLKKPYVAPGLALTAFAACLFAFISLAGDPEAGSPTVRITLPRPKTAVIHADNGDPQSKALTLDSQGQFPEAGVNGFEAPAADPTGTAGNTAVITLPGDADATVKPAAASATPAQPLAHAPIAGLFQAGAMGPLPVIAPSGMTAASAYARPFKSDGRPMVALIVGGLGLNPTTTKTAIEQLPPQVTLSFVPYTQNLQGWIDLARAAGHEVIVEVPMQPVNYPDNDPGPQTLLANARGEDLMARIGWVLSRCTGYFAVTNYQGAAFFKDKPGMNSFLTQLKTRGVGFIDDGQARDLGGAWARATADRIVDNQINATAITAQLSGLEATAKGRGKALGTGMAFPVTLAVALKWTQSLDAKGIQLAPASAMMR